MESEREHDLLSRAIDSYDRETVKKAQMIAIAALGALVLLIFILAAIL